MQESPESFTVFVVHQIDSECSKILRRKNVVYFMFSALSFHLTDHGNSIQEDITRKKKKKFYYSFRKYHSIYLICIYALQKLILLLSSRHYIEEDIRKARFR